LRGRADQVIGIIGDTSKRKEPGEHSTREKGEKKVHKVKGKDIHLLANNEGRGLELPLGRGGVQKIKPKKKGKTERRGGRGAGLETSTN